MFEEKTREEIIKELIMNRDILKPRLNESAYTSKQANEMVKNAKENMKTIENLNEMLTEAYHAKIEIKTEPDEMKNDISITYENKTLTVKFGHRLHEMISEAACDTSSISSTIAAAIRTAANDLEKAQEYAEWLQEIPLKENTLSKRQMIALKYLLNDNKDQIKIVNNFFREYKKHTPNYFPSVEMAMETIPSNINNDDLMLGYAIKAMLEIDNEKRDE